METIFVVQGKHHYIPGVQLQVYRDKPAAEKAALDMLNMIRADVFDDDTEEGLPPWIGDWESGVADTRKHLASSALYTGDEMDVWIEVR